MERGPSKSADCFEALCAWVAFVALAAQAQESERQTVSGARWKVGWPLMKKASKLNLLPTFRSFFSLHINSIHHARLWSLSRPLYLSLSSV